LGTGLNRSVFSRWMGKIFRQLIGVAAGEWVVFTLSAVVAFLLTYPASNTGSASVACPLAATMAIIYSSGYVRMRDMFRVGVVCALLRLLLLLLSFPMTKYLLVLKGIG